MSKPQRDAGTPSLTPPQRYCFVHIGTHKTGTTSIQAFLAQNRATLLELGVFVPKSAGNGEPEFACHHGIARQLLGSASTGLNGGLDGVIAELAASAVPSSCISSEDISLLHDRPELLRRLRDTIQAAGFTPKIVVYLRPQVSYSTAIYAANVQSGYRLSFATFVCDVINRGCYVWDGGFGPPFDYVLLLDAFAAVFGPDAMVVKPFRSDAPDTALLGSFINVILPQDQNLGRFAVPPLRANRTLTFAAVLQRLGIANNIDEHVRFAPFTIRELIRYWIRFAQGNRRLTKRYGVRIPVFALVDLVRAIPIRRTLAKTRQLWQARTSLANLDHARQ